MLWANILYLTVSRSLHMHHVFYVLKQPQRFLVFAKFYFTTHCLNGKETYICWQQLAKLNKQPSSTLIIDHSDDVHVYKYIFLRSSIWCYAYTYTQIKSNELYTIIVQFMKISPTLKQILYICRGKHMYIIYLSIYIYIYYNVVLLIFPFFGLHPSSFLVNVGCVRLMLRGFCRVILCWGFVVSFIHVVFL